MNILHINASDIGGGAARAAYRIHRALVDYGQAHGLHSRMRVIYKTSDDTSVISGDPAGQNPLWQRLRPRLIRWALRHVHSNNHSQLSIAWLGRGLGAELNLLYPAAGQDCLHLHWVGDYQVPGDTILSIEEVGRLRHPLVWTLHDQWAFCGAEHYTGLPERAASSERFSLGYTPASRPTHESGPDVNRQTWLRKRRAWRQPISIVCPSRWLADCARRSSLMAAWPITVIPHPISLNVWTPCDQAQARTLQGLPLDRPLVLFGAMGGTADPRKGADLLLQALQLLRAQVAGTPLEQLELLVFGQGHPAQRPDLGFPIHYRGRLHDDLSLRLLYAAADVMVVPSQQEAFGQTASEAHACGTPVVAFACGGLVDIVDDRITGALAEPFDPAALAAAILWVLEDPQRRRQLGAAARARAERLWDPALVVARYAEVYRQTMDASLPASLA